jgi:hypothetical protein
LARKLQVEDETQTLEAVAHCVEAKEEQLIFGCKLPAGLSLKCG